MPSLKELVERYRSFAKYGEPVALSAFEWTPAQTERFFSALDEDYHISRFLHFSRAEGTPYVIDGEEVTHLSIDAAIESIL